MAEYIAEPHARVLKDSISPEGHRLTTMEVTMHRFVLAEFNTHRLFSRNSASSRAIPGRLQRQRVQDTPAVPLEWPEKKRGMQGGTELPSEIQTACDAIWSHAAAYAANVAEYLDKQGVHKSVTNRLLEPFLYQTIIVSGTDEAYENYFALRCSPLAQPEIRHPSELMQAAYENSTPQELEHGEWHMPLVDKQTLIDIGKRQQQSGGTKQEFDAMVRKVSAARCARVSYLTHDGRRDIDKDLELYDRLTSAAPPHASPLEHVATPATGNTLGNFTGWAQLRHGVDND